MAVLGHVAHGDAEIRRGGEVDVVEPDAVAHERAAPAQTFQVGPVERDDRPGHDRDRSRLDRDVERLLDVVARRAAVEHLEAERLKNRALELDLAVYAVIDHHDKPPSSRSGHDAEATLTPPEVVLHG